VRSARCYDATHCVLSFASYVGTAASLPATMLVSAREVGREQQLPSHTGGFALSELQHRIRAAASDAFGITDDDVREAVEACLDDARDMARDLAYGQYDPELNDPWSCLFEAEAIIDRWNIGERNRLADLAYLAKGIAFGKAIHALLEEQS
jgi:hypothetical protein